VRGEKYGIYFSARSQTMRKFLSVPIEANVLMPYRRDIKTGESLLYSDAPCWAGNSTVDGVNPVTETFEAFEQGTRAKTDLDSIVNASVPNYDSGTQTGVGRIGPFLNIPPTPTGTTVLGPVLLDLNGSPVPGFVIAGAGSLALWQPATNFGDSSRYEVPPNTSRLVSNSTDNPGVFLTNTQAVFAPTPQALGIGIYGVENIPSEIGSFSISRTAPAGRVVAEFLGIYDLVAGSGSNCATKQPFSLRAFSPDADAGIVDQNTLDAIATSPGDYFIQCTPVGFTTEIYGYHGDGINVPPIFGQQATRIDMVSYANVLHDEGQVNVGDNVTHGAQPTGGAPPGNYTAAGWWRQVAEPTGSIFRQPGNDGNTLIQLSPRAGSERARRVLPHRASAGDLHHAGQYVFGAAYRRCERATSMSRGTSSRSSRRGRAPNDNRVAIGHRLQHQAGQHRRYPADANPFSYPLVDERWEAPR
jgi:hypothetical protein